METLNIVFFKTVALIGIIVMLLSALSIVDYIRLSFTARGTGEQVEAREDALYGTALLAGGFVIAALVHFIGMETIHSVVRQISVFGGLLGLCIGAVQIVRAVFIFLTSPGRSERKAEAKSILWRAVICTAAIIATFIVLKHLG